MNNFYRRIAEILEVPEDHISADFDLNSGDAPWDSLAIVSIIALIDELYEKTVDGKSLASCQKVSEIEALVKNS